MNDESAAPAPPALAANAGVVNQNTEVNRSSSATSGTETCICSITCVAMPNTTAITRYCSHSTAAAGGFSCRRPKSRRYR